MFNSAGLDNAEEQIRTRNVVKIKNKEKDDLAEVKTDLDVEINFIEELIEEYQVMPNKTQKEWDNKQMLEIKLEQLKRKI